MFITPTRFTSYQPLANNVKMAPKFGHAYEFKAKAGDKYLEELNSEIKRIFRAQRGVNFIVIEASSVLDASKPTWLYTKEDVQKSLAHYVDNYMRLAHHKSRIFEHTSYQIVKRTVDGSFVYGSMDPGQEKVYFSDEDKTITFKDLV